MNNEKSTLHIYNLHNTYVRVELLSVLNSYTTITWYFSVIPVVLLFSFIVFLLAGKLRVPFYFLAL